VTHLLVPVHPFLSVIVCMQWLTSCLHSQGLGSLQKLLLLQEAKA
jgi:hypothetical protein